MAWLPREWEPVALRLARADDAAFQMGELALNWSRAEGRGALTLGQVVQKTGELELVVTGIRPIPPLVSMLFSEAIHHLRAAIENTLFHLVETARGAAIPENQAYLVGLPVSDDREKFEKWQSKMTGRGLIELGSATTLGNRIAGLQPFADPVAVPSLDPELATLMNVQPEYAHPMVLLQKYSNIDKHRAIRMAATRTLIQRGDESFRLRDRSMRPIAVGDVLATVPLGVQIEVDTTSAVHVQRPDKSTWVSPGRELYEIHRHVSDVIIPTLVKGLALTRSIPPNINLGDTGQEVEDRIRSGNWEPAHKWMSSISLAAHDEGLESGRLVPPIVKRDG